MTNEAVKILNKCKETAKAANMTIQKEIPANHNDIWMHKVRIYKEYHSVCPLVGIGTLPIPLSPASVPLPPEPGGGSTLVCG